MERGRREDVGTCSSAALPVIWKAIARRGWNHSDFARFVAVSTASASRLLYGDMRAGRRVAAKCEELGVRLLLWDKPCPPNWKPHAYESLRPSAKAAADDPDDEDVAATGTDG